MPVWDHISSIFCAAGGWPLCVKRSVGFFTHLTFSSCICSACLCSKGQMKKLAETYFENMIFNHFLVVAFSYLKTLCLLTVRRWRTVSSVSATVKSFVMVTISRLYRWKARMKSLCWEADNLLSEVATQAQMMKLRVWSRKFLQWNHDPPL